MGDGGCVVGVRVVDVASLVRVVRARNAGSGVPSAMSYTSIVDGCQQRPK